MNAEKFPGHKTKTKINEKIKFKINFHKKREIINALYLCDATTDTPLNCIAKSSGRPVNCNHSNNHNITISKRMK